MNIRTTGRGLAAKLCLFIVLAVFTMNVHAEYYLVYPGPYLACNPPCVRKIYRRHYVRHVRRHFRRCYYPRHRTCWHRWPCRYRVVRPCCPPPVAPFSCRSCYGGGYSMRGYYYDVEPRDYSNIYPDQATGDDNPMFDPELNIDR